MGLSYSTTRFMTSAIQRNQFPEDKGSEVAFAGRSNSGKSSVINTLCRQNGLARTSNTPGRTQMINFFQITPQHRLVDLPGYGYAKAPASKRHHWRALVECYLTQRNSLNGIILVMDIRHTLTAYDRQMLEWCAHYRFSVHILLNKADKLNRAQVFNAVQTVQNALAGSNFGVQAFSVTKKSGLKDAYNVLDLWLCHHDSTT